MAKPVRQLKHTGAVLFLSDPGVHAERDATDWFRSCEEVRGGGRRRLFTSVADLPEASHYLNEWANLKNMNDQRIFHYLKQGLGEGKTEEQFHILCGPLSASVGPQGSAKKITFEVREHTLGVQAHEGVQPRWTPESETTMRG